MQETPHTYEVTLSEEQRHALQQLISKGKAPAFLMHGARYLLELFTRESSHGLRAHTTLRDGA
jgi:hypothetical protein